MKLSRHMLTHSDTPKRKLYTNDYEHVVYELPDGKVVGYTHLGNTTEVLIKHKEPKRKKLRKLKGQFELEKLAAEYDADTNPNR